MLRGRRANQVAQEVEDVGLAVEGLSKIVPKVEGGQDVVDPILETRGGSFSTPLASLAEGIQGPGKREPTVPVDPPGHIPLTLEPSKVMPACTRYPCATSTRLKASKVQEA